MLLISGDILSALSTSKVWISMKPLPPRTNLEVQLLDLPKKYTPSVWSA